MTRLRRFSRSIAAGLLANACGIGLMATSAWLITRASLRPPVLSLVVAMAAVQAFALGRGLFRYLQRLAVHDVALSELVERRLRLFDDLEPRVPCGLPQGATGALLNAFVADTEHVTQGTAQSSTAAVDIAASTAVGGLVAGVVDPAAAAVILAGAVSIVLWSFVCAGWARPAETSEAEVRSELAAATVDLVRSARELVCYGRADLIDERLDHLERRSAAATRRRALANGLARAGSTWIAGAALIVVLALGYRDHLPGVPLAVVGFVALATLDQVAVLPFVLADTGPAAAARRRLDRLATLARPVTEPLEDGGLVDHGDPPGGPPGVSVEDAVVTGRDGRTLLDGACLAVVAGERVALVGPSGSGKSSLLHTVLHFLECTTGRVCVGGADVGRTTRPTLARLVGWLPEDVHIFSATVGDNLRIADPAASDADCEDALRRVGLDGWLGGLPEGIGTAVGRGARPVSAGERQRLGLARSLLRRAPALLLDEPTAHLDPGTSESALREMMGAAAGRTVVVVTHEPDIADLVDRVVGMDSGRTADTVSFGPVAGRPDGG